MAYIDKCFYFDDGDREVNLAHPSGYDVSFWDQATVRWRQPEVNSRDKLVSIELWQSNPKLYGKKVEDDEICLTTQDATRLAMKLLNAVAEINNEKQFDSIINRVRQLEQLHSDTLDEWDDRVRNYKEEQEIKDAEKAQEIKVGKTSIMTCIRKFEGKYYTIIENLGLEVTGKTEEEVKRKTIRQIKSKWRTLKNKTNNELTPGMQEVKENLEKIFRGKNLKK